MVDVNTNLASLVQPFVGFQNGGNPRVSTVVTPSAAQAQQAGRSQAAGADTFGVVTGVRGELSALNSDNRELQRAINAAQVSLTTAREIEDRLSQVRELTALSANPALTESQFGEVEEEFTRVFSEIEELVTIAGEQEQNLVGAGASGFGVNSSTQPEFELEVDAFDFGLSVSGLLAREVSLSGIRDDAILPPDEEPTEPPDPTGEVPELDRRFTRDLLFNVVREFIGFSDRFSRSSEFVRDLAEDINETTREFEAEVGDRPGPGGQISVGFVAAATVLAVRGLNAERDGEEFDSRFFDGRRGEELRELTSRIQDDIREAFGAVPSDNDTGGDDDTTGGTGDSGSGDTGGGDTGTGGTDDGGSGDTGDIDVTAFLPPVVNALTSIESAQEQVSQGIQALESDLDRLQNQLTFNEDIQSVLREQFERVEEVPTQQAAAVAEQIGQSLSFQDLSIANERPDTVSSLFANSGSVFQPPSNDQSSQAEDDDFGSNNALTALGNFS